MKYLVSMLCMRLKKIRHIYIYIYIEVIITIYIHDKCTIYLFLYKWRSILKNIQICLFKKYSC